MTDEKDNQEIDQEQDDVCQENESFDVDGAQQVSLRIRRLLPDRRIDKYLQHRFPDFSRSLIQKLIKDGGVSVNDSPTKCSYKLAPRDRVDITLPPPPTNEIPPEDIPLDIIFEDDHILVLNKQPNIIVHPARGNRGGTLVNGLVYYSDSLSGLNGQFRPGIVHRLDRNTSGVIMIAKTDTAHWRIAHQFEHRLTQKAYIAVVQGTLELDADLINLPLGRHKKVREKYDVMPETGKPASTTYQVLQRFRGYTLMKLMPKTGRTHQLRVHMSYLKHPIVADDMYGGKLVTLGQRADGQELPTTGQVGCDLDPDQPAIVRHALHAAELTLRHPISGEMMTFKSPLYHDIDLLVKLLERYRKKK